MNEQKTDTLKSFDLKRFFFTNIRQFTLVALIIVISVLVQIRTEGRFLSSQNLYDLFRESAILVMVSVGMMLVILTGGIDLSVGSVMALSGMIGALILKSNQNINLLLLFIIAIAIGCFCGIINGFIVSRFHIQAMIATLGTQYIFRGLIYLFSKGGWVAQLYMTKPFLAITTDKILGINNLVWIAIIITLFAIVFLRFIKAGRYIYGVGNSEDSAEISGIKTRQIKFMAYTLFGIIAGLAGLLWVCKYGNAQSESATGYELNVIAAVVLGGVSISGGVGNVLGVFLGALIIGILNNILPLIQVSTYWQMAIRGAIIIISVIINALTQRNIQKRSLRKRA
jgi:rhamnose transport system permease protein